MTSEKKIVFHNYYNSLNHQNFLFENDDAPGIGEGLLKPFKVLRQIAKLANLSVATRDYFNNNEKIDAYFFLDLPKESDSVYKEAKRSQSHLYLVLMESPIIRPDNYKKENHHHFKKIFTWDSKLVDNIKYFKMCIPQNPSPIIKVSHHSKRKLCALIASKKKSHHPGELYSKRIEAIEFFNKYYPNEFDLFGGSWDKDVYSDKLKFLNLLNRLPFKIPISLQVRYGVYKGRINQKLEVLNQYKFSICFENFSNAPGYITEKIFDSFYAGCIPVYWGAPDVLDYIPKDCFIDMRDFTTFEDLYAYLNSLGSSALSNYQENISKFLLSDEYKIFLPEHFSSVVLQDFLNEK